MKTLVLRKHSIQDGPNGSLGPKGLELARQQANLISDRGIGFEMLFYAPFIGEMQTALIFCEGLNYIPSTMPIVSGVGDVGLLKKIMTDDFRSAVANGKPSFMAIMQIHGESNLQEWSEQAHESILAMFSQLEHGESGIGFFPCPLIKLGGWSCGVKASIPNWDKLGPMEGLVFSFETQRKILVNWKASKQPGLG